MQAMPALSIKSLDPKHERRLALTVIVLAVVAIAWTAWRYLPDWLEGSLPGTPVSPQPAERGKADDAARSLADYALFGAAPANDAGLPGEVVINAPETDLDLSLRGTLAADAPEHALAIIADGEGTERSYRVGEELPGGAELHRVYRDRVILRRGGELEALKLREPERAAAVGGEAPDRNAPARAASTRGQAASPEIRDKVREFRRDPAELLRQFAAVPVQDGGRMVGVRLRSTGEGGDLLSQVGLRSTDVVTSVNGIPVTDMSRAGELMTQLRSAGSFRVTVLRNGREQQISVSLGQ